MGRSIQYKEKYLYPRLRNPEKAIAYLSECRKDKNPAVFFSAVHDVIQAGGDVDVAVLLERSLKLGARE